MRDGTQLPNYRRDFFPNLNWSLRLKGLTDKAVQPKPRTGALISNPFIATHTHTHTPQKAMENTDLNVMCDDRFNMEFIVSA